MIDNKESGKPMKKYETLIIGTGFSGIGLAIKLKQANHHDFVILEKADSVAGVWRDNTYPGAACDVPSHLYSFSFEPNPNWSRRYSPQSEIKAYLENCVAKHQLNEHIEFKHEVVSAKFDQDKGVWDVTTKCGTQYQATYLIPAMGQLSLPAIPSIKGVENFKGDSFHTAHWPVDYDFSNKSVAVIGTGASAIQLVPVIAKEAKQIHLLQRTAPYILHKPDKEYSPSQIKRFNRWPWLLKLSRLSVYLIHEFRSIAFGGQQSMRKLPQLQWKMQMQKIIKEPALRKKLTPNYQIACKRVLISDNYYAALNLPNVKLSTETIDTISNGGINTRDGELLGVDTIIYATGFRTEDFLAPLEIQGLANKDLNQSWRDGAEAYLGMAINGFPNMLIMYGPNTNSGHNSIIYTLEGQMDYILQYMDYKEKSAADYLDVKASSLKSFNNKIQKKLKNTVWNTGGCNSWYLTKDGKNTSNWPGFSFLYRKAVKKINLSDYDAKKEQMNKSS